MQKTLKTFWVIALITVFTIAFSQNESKHQLGFHVSTGLDIPFTIYHYPTKFVYEKLSFPFPNFQIGFSVKSRLSPKIKLNYGITFKQNNQFSYYYIGLCGAEPTGPENNKVKEIDGEGSLNLPFRVNIYGKKKNIYFLAGLDLSFPIYYTTTISGSNYYNKKYLKTYIETDKYHFAKRFNVPITLGMGFDIQKNKTALYIEPNIQLSGLIASYKKSNISHQGYFSIGVNVMGLYSIQKK